MKSLSLKNTNLRLMYFILTLFFLTSCKVQFISSFDEATYKQINTVSKEFDRFYLQIYEIKDNKGRAYTNFVSQYVNLEVEINDLINKNNQRKLNKNSTESCKNLLLLFKKYKEKHKNDNFISDSDIILNKNYIEDILNAIRRGELTKKLNN